MSKLVDVVVGDLFYESGWCKLIEIDFLGSHCSTVVVFCSDEDRPLDQGQRDAFMKFWESRVRLISNAEDSILSHYQEIRPGLIEKFPSVAVDKVAPIVFDKPGLLRLVQLESIFFPEDFGSGKRVFGILANCSWDPGLGLAVRFENEMIVEVGPQDILL